MHMQKNAREEREGEPGNYYYVMVDVGEHYSALSSNRTVVHIQRVDSTNIHHHMIISTRISLSFFPFHFLRACVGELGVPGNETIILIVYMCTCISSETQ